MNTNEPGYRASLLVLAWAAVATPVAGRQFPDPQLKPELVIRAVASNAVYTSRQGKYDGGKFAVYVPTAYAPEKPMPLVVSSHGAGGTGPKEIGGWSRLAEQYGFIAVCPSYGSATFRGATTALKLVIHQDEALLKDIMERVLRSLNIDRAHILHTGFSGGGVPTWYAAMRHPEWFTALCFRSANFYGEKTESIGKKMDWKKRPIYLFGGDKDNPIIITKSPVMGGGEGPAALDFLKRLHCEKLKHEILPGGGHDSHPDLAAKWFAEEVIGNDSVGSKK